MNVSACPASNDQCQNSNITPTQLQLQIFSCAVVVTIVSQNREMSISLLALTQKPVFSIRLFFCLCFVYPAIPEKTTQSSLHEELRSI